MRFWRLGSWLCLAVCVVAPSAAAAPSTPSEKQPSPEAGAIKARVVLVGAAGRDPELPRLLRELLAQRQLSADITSQNRFENRELLQPKLDGTSVRVFVVPGQSDELRLYFRAPDGERFLLRTLQLRSGFDELGREQLGQVIDTAVALLAQSSEGLTRAEAEAALDAQPTEAAAPSAPLPTPAPITTRHAPPQTLGPSAREKQTSLQGWFAVRYGGSLTSADAGPSHGPGLELGIGLQRRHARLRVRALGERAFTQHFDLPAIAADISGVRLRLALDAGLTLRGPHELWLSAAFGQDRERVVPTATTGSNVKPASAFGHDTEALHGEARYETGTGLVRLAVALGVDLSLVTTHYDVVGQNGRQSLLALWLFRPTASLALALAPRWATF